MKQGKSITELANEIQRQQNNKVDYRVTTPKLTATDMGLIAVGDLGVFDLTNNANGQIAQRLKIPKIYFDKMKIEAPSLWAQNVNHWFNVNSEKRLVRTLDGKVRAFLSDKYRTLDNFDLLEAIMPSLLKRKDLKIVSSEVTEDKFYLKAIFTDLSREVTSSSTLNDIVNFGIIISNSEVGAGSLRIQPMSERLVCLNGMISNVSMKKYHVG